MIPESVRIRLRTEMAKLQAYWDSQTDLLVIFGPGGNIIKISASCETHLGYHPDEMEGTSYLDYIHPNDLHDTVETGGIMAKEGHKIWTFRNRYRARDGHYVWLMWYSTPPIRGRIYAVAKYVSLA